AIKLAVELLKILKPDGSGRIAVIDSEKGSASHYAHLFDFETCPLENHSPITYYDTIVAAELAGFDFIIIDSLSHAWVGKDGALDQVDKFASRDKGNSFGAWRHVTPQQTKLIDKIMSCRAHMIVTMRVKVEWLVEKDDRTGKSKPTKVGMAPVQREGLEYEFDVVGDLDDMNVFRVTKTRCPELAQAVIEKPGEQVARILATWLTIGSPMVEAPPKVEEPAVNARIEDPEIKALFDELNAPEAKRLATAEKYRDNGKLKEILVKRVDEQRADQAKAKAKVDAKNPPATPPAVEPASGAS
ncbi:MAG: hypothetical protein EPN91_06790, partial [Salinibacterium sp.]